MINLIKRFVVVLVVLFLIIIFLQPNFGWVKYAPEVYSTRQPIQKNISNAHMFEYKNFQIVPLAEFVVEARVLHKRKYYFGTEAKLSPVDLALGWGMMANYRVIDKLKISQNFRFYHYRYSEAPISPNDIVQQSANMHIIPANDEVAKKIKRIRRGQIVTIKGKLINVHRDDGWSWITSTTRNDSGAGACEIIWVEDFKIK